MSTLAVGLFQRQEPGMGRSFVLSALVHIVLAAILVLGVRWQVRAPDTVTVDLVDAPPPPAPVVEAPKPEPMVKPQVKPEPPRIKPQIAVPEKKLIKDPPKKPPPKPKDDPEFEKRLREQVAQEQKILDQQRQERELRELLARKEAEAARAAASARAKAMNEYIGRLQATIRRNIRESALEGIPGNPAALVDVVQLPTGEVLSVRIRKSSGYPRYDEEIERAIRKSSPLPLPPRPDMFERELNLTFRPLDK